MAAKNGEPAAKPPAPAGVLQPGAIKPTEDDEPPWWRTPAILGGIVVGTFIILGVVSLMGRRTPPRPPLAHQPPEAAVALDLDDVPGDALARPVKIPGAGAIPNVPAVAAGPRAAAHGGRARRGHPSKPQPPQGPKQEEPRKPSGAIIYKPGGW